MKSRSHACLVRFVLSSFVYVTAHPSRPEENFVTRHIRCRTSQITVNLGCIMRVVSRLESTSLSCLQKRVLCAKQLYEGPGTNFFESHVSDSLDAILILSIHQPLLIVHHDSLDQFSIFSAGKKQGTSVRKLIWSAGEAAGKHKSKGARRAPCLQNATIRRARAN